MDTRTAAAARPFAFPARNVLDAVERRASKARDEQLETALAEADARGHAEGLARGREDAKAEARELLESSYREGSEKGHMAGLAEMHAATEALRNALDAFALERGNVVAEAEAFCVDLALAIVARLVEGDDTRADFIRRWTREAIKALAPETPSAVFLGPTDFKCIGDTMNDLPLREDITLAPGTARVDAGRLLVESSLDEAFAQIRSAVLESRAKRIRKKSRHEKTPDPEVATPDAV